MDAAETASATDKARILYFLYFMVRSLLQRDSVEFQCGDMLIWRNAISYCAKLERGLARYQYPDRDVNPPNALRRNEENSSSLRWNGIAPV
jgi:hypothetical protein